MIAHNTPAFVAWHRYFLHIYEGTLQKQCNYEGHLVYWDWSLDAENLTASPIWDSDMGFGGDGNKSLEESVPLGCCVTDGPFSNITVQYYGTEQQTHCLSRKLIDKDHFDHIFGSHVNSDALQKITNEPDYASFNTKLEDGPHNAIPRTIRGDFYRVTAPNGKSLTRLKSNSSCQ